MIYVYCLGCVITGGTLLGFSTNPNATVAAGLLVGHAMVLSTLARKDHR